MGMFDYVKCEVPLPDDFEGSLQTKDLDCDMVTHTITKEGRLIREWITHVTEVPKAERPYPDGEGIFELCGSMRRHKTSADANYHGFLNFYGSSGKHEDDTYRWHEYNAKFTDGNLVEILKIEESLG